MPKPVKFSIHRYEPNQEPGMPTISEYVGKTWPDPKASPPPPYVLGLRDTWGYYYGVAGDTTETELIVSILGRDTDAPISELFKGFTTVPAAGHELVDAILGTLAQRPLDEPNRYLKAIAWATHFDDKSKSLGLKEVASWWLYYPEGAIYSNADSLADGSLCRVAVEEEPFLGRVSSGGVSHLSTTTEPHMDWDTSELRYKGRTVCCKLLETLSQEKDFEVDHLEVATLTKQNVGKEITCPQCRTNALLLMYWNWFGAAVFQKAASKEWQGFTASMPITFSKDYLLLTGQGPDKLVDLDDAKTKSYLKRLNIGIGPNLRIAGTAKIHYNAQISANTTLGNNVSIGIEVDMGENVTLEEGVNLEYLVIVGEDCVIGKNSQVGEQCEIDRRVRIGGNVAIGKYCKIDQDVQIDERARIGDSAYLGEGLHIQPGQDIAPKQRLTVNGEIQSGY